MKIRKMTKDQAAKFVGQIDGLSDSDFQDLLQRWKRREVDGIPNDYLKLRDAIVSVFDTNISKGGYAIDLSVGLALYELLVPGKTLSVVDANDDDFWRYLSCVVFPDLTYERYPKPGKGDIRLNAKRFYAHTRRIWMKTLWWYVHLSWQGDSEKTRMILERCGTDAISQLFERPGKGYRLPLYRELMRVYAESGKNNAELFKRLQAQNLVDCRMIEPALMEDGEKGYVTHLFKQLDS